MPDWGELANSLGQLMSQYGLVAIFLIMLVKQTGFPMPVPSDFIMLAAAAWAATGQVVAWQAFVAILVAIVAGSSLQYLVARKFGEQFLERFGRRIGFSSEQLEETRQTILEGGAKAVALSLLLPGIRVATVPAAGLAAMPYMSFAAGLLVGRGSFLVVHFLVGYLGFPFLSFLLGEQSLPILIGLSVLTTAGFLGWMVWSRRTRVEKDNGDSPGRRGTGDWGEGACPACMVIGAARRSRYASRAVSVRPQAGQRARQA